MQQSEQINELAAALAAAQGDFVSAKKDAENPFFKSKYADLASITEAVRPAAKHGLAHTQFVSTDPDKKLVIVTTMLMHKSGQWISDSFSLPVPEWKAQAIGSSTTYGRRYGLQAAYGLAAEDDDGNAASGKGSQKQALKESETGEQTIFFGGKIEAESEDDTKFYYQFADGVVFSPKATDDGRLANKVGQTVKLKVFKRALPNGVQMYELYEVSHVAAAGKPAPAQKPARQETDSHGKPYYEESPDGKEARFRVSAVKDGMSKNKNPYLIVEYGLTRGESVFCFDTKFMDEIKTWKSGDVATVGLETSGNFRSITAIKSVQRGAVSTATEK